MLKINESEQEYRFGNSGPKYLLRGPRVDFGLVVLQPGEDFQKQYKRYISIRDLLKQLQKKYGDITLELVDQSLCRQRVSGPLWFQRTHF